MGFKVLRLFTYLFPMVLFTSLMVLFLSLDVTARELTTSSNHMTTTRELTTNPNEMITRMDIKHIHRRLMFHRRDNVIQATVVGRPTTILVLVTAVKRNITPSYNWITC
ncbi:E3 UFM1-protein ligase 1 [Striga asiatica]|uniref:E3 UFM1-protein ligase 1 n=1 Tax=Striga asiatica TaxID=4170 RepID=A0A5A7PTB0_STRAF|nr:E3 UFM1-protein ligase 1 [Striga asiatica]